MILSGTERGKGYQTENFAKPSLAVGLAADYEGSGCEEAKAGGLEKPAIEIGVQHTPTSYSSKMKIFFCVNAYYSITCMRLYGFSSLVLDVRVYV